MGPLDYIVIEFKGNKFKGKILPALAEVVGADVIRVLDLMFISKDEAGKLTLRELDELALDELVLFDPLAADVDAVFPKQDVAKLGAMLENNCSAAIFLIEHLWATALAETVWDANGRVIAQERIPREVAEQAFAYRAAVTPNAVTPQGARTSTARPVMAPSLLANH